MIFAMTSKTSNSMESLLKLPFHIFLYQYNLLTQKVKEVIDLVKEHRELLSSLANYIV